MKLESPIDVAEKESVVEALQSGGVVCMPSDTIYGLFAAVHDQNAVAQVFTLKARSATEALPILISSIADFAELGIQATDAQKTQLQASWPPRTTYVFDVDAKPLPWLLGSMPGMAVRMPQAAWLLEILAKTGPCVATSANKTGSSASTDLKQAQEYFGDTVDLYVDGGTLKDKPSRIMELDSDGTEGRQYR